MKNGTARRCGTKHMSKSKRAKHTILGALLDVEMSKKCTPLWRAAHFEVKSVKNWRSRTTFGSWDVEKVRAFVAQSTFPVRTCEAHQVRSTFWGWDVEKVHAVVARSKFRSQNVKRTTCSDHFWTFRCRFAWQARGIVHLVKSEQNVRVLWQFQKRWQAWEMWRVLISWEGCILQHQIFRFAKMILRDKRSTSWQAQYTTVHHTTPHCTNYTILIAPHHSKQQQQQLQLQLQLQLHYNNYTTRQLQFHYTTATTTSALHHTTSSRPLQPLHHCNHSPPNKYNSNHLSVHQRIRSAIHASQQLTSPIVSYLWNFRHRLVRYYWDKRRRRRIKRRRRDEDRAVDQKQLE